MTYCQWKFNPMSNVSKIRMLPCSHFPLVKEALFGIYHYNGALGEFHTQKGQKKKKSHCWLPESTELLSALSCLTCGRTVFLLCLLHRIQNWIDLWTNCLYPNQWLTYGSQWVLRNEILKPGDFSKTSKFIGENCWAKLRHTHTHTQKLFILLTYKQWQHFFPDRSLGCHLKQHQNCFKGSAKSLHFSSWTISTACSLLHNTIHWETSDWVRPFFFFFFSFP